MLSPLIKKPPVWPLPDPLQDPSWYGEVWVKYPLNHGLSSSCASEVFRARSLFRIVMNEFCDAAYSKDSEVDIDLAYQLRERLEGWYNSLREPLTPKRIVLPGQLQIQYALHLYLLIAFIYFVKQPVLMTNAVCTTITCC